jgi:hypothetical protein
VRKVIVAAAVAFQSVTPAAAGTTTYAGVWAIHDTGNGCQAGAESQGGAGVVLDAADQSRVNFVFHNPSWRSIESGKTYSIEVEFDGARRWPLETTGTAFRTAAKTSPGLRAIAPYTTRDDRNLLREFATSRKMSLRRNGSEIVSYPLTGSFEAVEALMTCLEPYGMGDTFDNGDP